MMCHKVVFRRYNGHWYMVTGTRGYACTRDFEKFLDLQYPFYEVFITDTNNLPSCWFQVTVTREGGKVLTEFIDLQNGETYTVRQCPKMFEDLELPTKFYISRGNS